MNRDHWRGRAVALAFFFVVLQGCQSNAPIRTSQYDATREAAEKLTLAEARAAVETIRDVHEKGWGCQTRAPGLRHDKEPGVHHTFPVTKVTYGDEYLELGFNGPERVRIRYRDLSKVRLEDKTFAGDNRWVYVSLETQGGHIQLSCPAGAFRQLSDEGAKRLADAFLTLRIEHARAESARDAAFRQAAERYRAANPKPDFPENARRFRVQAEAALRDKRFDEAVQYYHQALDLAPWWPEGRFNLALIYGETKSYESAIREMKRYLAVVPGAQNARAAQDKIYEWEALVPKK